MLWITAGAVWYLATVLRDHRERFLFGSLVAGLAVAAILNVVNPDDLIVRTNAARPDAPARFDGDVHARPERGRRAGPDRGAADDARAPARDRGEAPVAALGSGAEPRTGEAGTTAAGARCTRRPRTRRCCARPSSRSRRRRRLDPAPVRAPADGASTSTSRSRTRDRKPALMAPIGSRRARICSAGWNSSARVCCRSCFRIDGGGLAGPQRGRAVRSRNARARSAGVCPGNSTITRYRSSRWWASLPPTASSGRPWRRSWRAFSASSAATLASEPWYGFSSSKPSMPSGPASAARRWRPRPIQNVSTCGTTTTAPRCCAAATAPRSERNFGGGALGNGGSQPVEQQVLERSDRQLDAPDRLDAARRVGGLPAAAPARTPGCRRGR